MWQQCFIPWCNKWTIVSLVISSTMGYLILVNSDPLTTAINSKDASQCYTTLITISTIKKNIAWTVGVFLCTCAVGKVIFVQPPLSCAVGHSEMREDSKLLDLLYAIKQWAEVKSLFGFFMNAIYQIWEVVTIIYFMQTREFQYQKFIFSW